MRGELIVTFLALVVCSIQADPEKADKKHTVVAIVIKHNQPHNKNGATEVKVDGHKISTMSAPAPVPQNVQPARPVLPVQPVAPVVPVVKPFIPLQPAPVPLKPFIPLKPAPVPQNIQPLPFNPAPVQQNTQAMPVPPPMPQPLAAPQVNTASDVTVNVHQVLKNDEKKKKVDDIYKKHPEIYPCDDYSPICHYYSIQAPDKGHIAQCRDVWMQKNCRKTCGFCKIPWGAFLGCNDLDNCKKMAKSACIHNWIKHTCRNKCGICSPFERVGSSGVYVGKKKAGVPKLTDTEEEGSTMVEDGSGAEESMDVTDEEEEREAHGDQQDEDEVDASEEDEEPQQEKDESSGESTDDITDEELSADDGKQEKEPTKQRRMILSHGASQ